MAVATLLTGPFRAVAAERIERDHYTHSVPSGKSHYFEYEDAIVVYSIPANRNIARFLLDPGKSVWELSRLWAPDGHRDNLLTQAISDTAKQIREIENPDALVSYADPSVGHSGGVYRAASWIFHGQSEEVRAYRGKDGEIIARRAFHSGRKSMTKAEIEAKGFKEIKLPGKLRFVRPLSRYARKRLRR